MTAARPTSAPMAERLAGEFRQQMDAILVMAEGLSRHALSPHAQAHIAGIVETAQAVRELAANALDVALARSGALPFENRPQRLATFVDELEARWRSRAATTGATLMVSYDGDPEAAASLDPARLQQMFDGFIRHALAATRSGAVEARLAARRVGEAIHIEGFVRNAGLTAACAGDPLDFNTLEARFGFDVALGVSLSRRLVDQLTGTLKVEGNAGGGETVVFTFFAAAVAEAQPEAPEPAAARAAHVLVVDDNATNRMVAETLCEMFDCTTESVVDGVEAVEAAATGRFDLILMDIKMPRMDGVSATLEIRKLPGLPGRVPIIALTANVDPDDARSYLAAGMNDVVEKPMKPDTLLLALQNALAAAAASPNGSAAAA
ncbi:MAG TPA: response regulator [Phenylobacterium sp.]|nr:response regulator [Phenylobacterium sp.]